MVTPTPMTVSANPQGELGEWPNMWSLRTLSGKSVFFLVARAGLLIALSIHSALFGDTLLLVLAVTALGVDLAHTVLQAHIQIRGRALQQWVKRLVVGDLEYHVDMPGGDEIAMYGRVLETLRQSLIRSRQLELEQKELSEELRKKQ